MPHTVPGGIDMRTLAGIALGATAVILAWILWRPTIAWALSRGDG